MQIKVEHVEGEKRALVWQGSSADARKKALGVMRSTQGAKATKGAKQWLKMLDSDGVLV